MAQYESYRGQGGNPSPYGQAGNPYEDDTSYGGNPYSSGQYDRQQGYEMGTLDQSNPNRILEESRAIDAYCEELEARQERLSQTQQAFINDTTGGSQDALKAESEALLGAYRDLVSRTKRLKQDKDSGNPRNAPQVGRVDRRVKTSMNKFQKLDSEFRSKLQERMVREYKIVRPDASDAEAREAVQDPDVQIYSQALMSSDRRGQATSILQAVRGRHAAIQKIEQDMLQLAAMFQDLDAIVVQQEAQVTSIEQRGEEVQDHVTKANVELDGAVQKARAARKKKWICLGIGVAIVVVIIIVIVVAVLLTRGTK